MGLKGGLLSQEAVKQATAQGSGSYDSVDKEIFKVTVSHKVVFLFCL